MEMHQLRYVVAVSRAGNFSRAAEQCHVSQPSLSQQILKLEEELGERLFDRMKREAKLTRHGEAFLPRAVKILEETDGVIVGKALGVFGERLRDDAKRFDGVAARFENSFRVAEELGGP